MVSLHYIHKSYGQKKILNDISLSLSPGEITCLLGASGCGKSTLLRIFGGLIKPDKGEVHVAEKSCAFVFQETRLLPWLTVAENLALALPFWDKKKSEKINIALKKVHLHGAQKMYPDSLSGGMAQRACIARALLQSPKVLLMDEPFAALDALTRSEQQRMLYELINRQNEHCCLFVTHDIEEAQAIGHRILVMRDSLIVAEYVRDESGFPNDIKQQILVYLQR